MSIPRSPNRDMEKKNIKKDATAGVMLSGSTCYSVVHFSHSHATQPLLKAKADLERREGYEKGWLRFKAREQVHVMSTIMYIFTYIGRIF